MDIDTLQKYVITIGVAIEAIYVLWKMLTGNSPQGPASRSINVLTQLLIAVGVIAFLYGGATFAFVSGKVDPAREACLKDIDTYSLKSTQVCAQQVNLQYKKDAKPALLTIGGSFIWIAIILFIYNLSTKARGVHIIFEIFLSILGIWLIVTNR